jgi:alpha,alpha-trehalase
VIISVDPRDAAAGVEVECRGRVVQLMPGTTVRFPG